LSAAAKRTSFPVKSATTRFATGKARSSPSKEKYEPGSFENLERVSPIDALTGPIVRGDDPTIAAHLIALQKKFPDYIGAYRLLAGLNVDLAKQKGAVSEADFPSLNLRTLN